MKGFRYIAKRQFGALLKWAFVLLLSGGYQGAFSMESEGPFTLDTPSGKLRGERYLLKDGTRGMRFLGIPFAKPPVGSLRFAAPVESGPWRGILEARDFGPMCYQPVKTDVWDTVESNVDLVNLEDQLKRALVAELGKDLYEEQVEELHDELRMEVEKVQMKKKRQARRQERCSGTYSDSSSDENNTECGVHRTSSNSDSRPPDGISSDSASFIPDISDSSNSNRNKNRSEIKTAAAFSSNTDESILDETHLNNNQTGLLSRLKAMIHNPISNSKVKNELGNLELGGDPFDGHSSPSSTWEEKKMPTKSITDDLANGGWKDVSGFHTKSSIKGEKLDGQEEKHQHHKETEENGAFSESLKDGKRNTKNSMKYLYMQQKRIHEYEISEDCLTLNVYTPILEGSQKTGFSEGDSGQRLRDLPILVYIHGGSFYSNGGRLYPGEKLATKGIVVVTINYRLGPFGFLSTGDRWARGNWGLLDQRLAVQWVQRHAHAFHASKEKLLLVGNSAGGASVILHLVSPLSRGLFSRAAALSGCSLAPWAIQNRPKHFAKKLASDVGCPDEPVPELLSCLRKTDAEAINQAYADKNIQDGLGIAFAPVVEGEVPGAFLPRTPRKLLEEGSLPPVPLIMTLTRDEVSMWLRHKHDNISLMEAEQWMEYLMREKYPDLENLALAAVLHAVWASYLYRHSHPVDGDPQPMVPIKTISELMSDVGLRVPCAEEAKLLSRWTNLYFGEFSYSSPDDFRIGDQKWIGSYHESDLQFLFGQPFLGLANTLRVPQDRVVADTFMDLLLAFAHTGVPELDELEWPQYNQSHLVHLEMNERLTLSHNLVQHKLCFWQQFIPLMTTWPMKPLEPSMANHEIWPSMIITLTAPTLIITLLQIHLFGLS